MDELRMDRAINRIEAALTRIERSALNRPAGDNAGGGQDDILRRRVGAALADLDSLIGTLER